MASITKNEYREHAEVARVQGESDRILAVWGNWLSRPR